MTHICVSKLTIIGSDNGLSPGRRQAIIWTNAGILLIRPLGTNFNEMLIEILTFSFTKMRLKVSSAKWRPFCLGLNVLILRIIMISIKMFSVILQHLSFGRSICNLYYTNKYKKTSLTLPSAFCLLMVVWGPSQYKMLPHLHMYSHYKNKMSQDHLIFILIPGIKPL